MAITRSLARLCAGASLFVLSSAAWSQDSQSADPAQSEAAKPNSLRSGNNKAPSAAQIEEIVVTGSRVIQNGNNSPTPVTVVSTAQLLQTTPSNIQDALQTLPVFSGGRNSTTNPGNSSQNNASHTLNLRNIGTTRTLILYDGKRVAPTSPLGEVDADFLPSMLVQRVDVVTGGASAVYGSDAVAGVVNFITDRNYNGIKADIQKGISQYGDGSQFRFGVAGGKQITDRLHIEGSFEHFFQPGIFSRLSRPYGRRTLTIQGAGTAANPYTIVENTRISNSSFVGLITAGTSAITGNPGNPFAGYQFSSNGVLTPFVNGATTGSGNIQSGGDGAYYSASSLVSMYRSDQAFGRADYDLTDDIHIYAEAVGNWTHNINNHQYFETTRPVILSSTNGFLPTTVSNAMLAAGLNSFNFSKMITTAPVYRPETHAKGYMAIGGIEGKLGSKWKWDVGFTHTQNDQYTRNNGNVDQQKYLAAIDAVDQGLLTSGVRNGNIVCRVTITNPGLYPGCVPLNMFGPTSESQAAIDYIEKVTHFHARTRMNDASASIAGSPVDLWAGPLQLALSGEWRKLDYMLTSDALPIPADCTGLTAVRNANGTANCTASTLKYVSNVLANRSLVSQTVKEVALEGDLPLLKDLPFIRSLNLNAAGRFTHYDTSGSVKTWKVGLEWHVNDQITLRGTRSRDIRAPNLNDLFAPTLVNPAGASDYHVLAANGSPTSYQANYNTLANPDLKPEVAMTWTAGVVLKPNFIPRFSLAVDWYQIKIGNAISTIAGNNATIQQICEKSNGTSSYCALIHRPLPFSDHTAANLATSFDQIPQNAQTISTHGIDFEANYSLPIATGRLSLRGLLSWQPKLTTVQFVGAPVLNAAGTQALPKYRGTLFAKYEIGNFAIDIQEKYRSHIFYNADRSFIYAVPPLKPAAYTNLNFTMKVKPIDFFLNISNLFNKFVPYATGGTVPGLFNGAADDPIGRYFTVGARVRM